MIHKILVGVPILYDAEMCNKSIDSVINESDVVIVNNGKLDLKRDDIYQIDNTANYFVNKSWNQILQFFLANNYEQLVIMNSDLFMQAGWSEKLDSEVSCIPTDGSHLEDTEVFEGTPGVFIHLNRKMAEIVYPIPDYIKIWFGDNWIYGILRGLWIPTVIKAGLIAEHYQGGSQSVGILPDKAEIIEQDKKQWVLYGEKDINNKVSTEIANNDWKNDKKR